MAPTGRIVSCTGQMRSRPRRAAPAAGRGVSGHNMTGPVLVQYALDEVRAQWVRLADGLQIQRVYAHLAEVRDVLAGDDPLPDVDGVRGHQLVALPATFGALAVAARPYIIRPELAHWLEVPLRLGEVSEEPAPLHAAARDVAAEMRSRRPSDLADAVEAVCL